METQEIRYDNIGEHEVGDIWGCKKYGIFVVISQRPAVWRGEDRDVYAHIDTWYTIRDATEAERVLWDAAVDAAQARRELRKRLGAESSTYRFDATRRQLVSNQRMLDSYDDRWEPPADIDLDDEAFATEQRYLDALAQLHGHAQQEVA